MPDTDPFDRHPLGRDVARLRVQRGWSKEEAARKAGVSSITWKRVEDGLRVQDAKLALVLAVLGVDPDLSTISNQGAVITETPVDDDTARDRDSLLYRRPDGLSDGEWERLKTETRDYLEYLIGKAARER